MASSRRERWRDVAFYLRPASQGEPMTDTPNAPDSELTPDRMTAADPTAQANVERSLTFRRDYYKYALGIATALLAFSVTLQPTLSRAPVHLWLLFPTWVSLGLAILAGLRLHLLWAKFLITFSDHRQDRTAGNAAREPITRSRQLHDWVLAGALIVGVIGIALFASLNLPYIAPKTEAANAGGEAAVAAPEPVSQPGQIDASTPEMGPC